MAEKPKKVCSKCGGSGLVADKSSEGVGTCPKCKGDGFVYA